MINGVCASQVYLPNSTEYLTVFAFFCDTFLHITKQEWTQRFNDQLVLDSKLKPITIHQKYQGNTHIFYYRFLDNEINIPFKHHILFENDSLLVVDKPHFLTISPTGKYIQQTLLVRLKHQTQNPELTPIHRLDRETAGIVLFCKKPESRALYQQLFAEKKVKKIYHAIAPYRSNLHFPLTICHHMEKSHPFYTMKIVPNKEPNSETTITLLDHNKQCAKYHLSPKTGKQHQLRVHLNALNIPILNDSFYPDVHHKADADFSNPLQLLAKEIHFIDPYTQAKMSFYSLQDLHLP